MLIKKSIVFVGAALFFITTLPRNCFAYLDPGSGSFIVQLVIGFFIGGLFTLKVYGKRFIASLRGLFTRKQQKKNDE